MQKNNPNNNLAQFVDNYLKKKENLFKNASFKESYFFL